MLTNGVVTISDTLVQDTQLTARRLAGRSTIRWRVRARNLSGWGPWSGYRQLRYLPLPAMVRLTSPADSARLDSAVSPLLTWTTTESDVTAYRVEVYRNAEVVVADSTLAVRQKALASVQPNIWYRWRVQARNASGWGEWSDWRVFMIRRDTTTSVDEYAQASVITAYPNPALDVVIIASEDVSSNELVVLDIYGNVVSHIDDGAGKPLISLNTAYLPSGTYLVRRGSVWCRFVKQR